MRRIVAGACCAMLLGFTGCGDDKPAVDAPTETTAVAGGGAECENTNNNFTVADDPEVQKVIDQKAAIEERMEDDPTRTELEAAVADAKAAHTAALDLDRAGLCENDIADLDGAIEDLEGQSKHLD